MAYIKIKEITKYFDFNKFVATEDLPKYTKDYIYSGEEIVSSYKTFRDYGIFSTDKMVLFDNAISINPFKMIYTIPYSKITSLAITFRPNRVELNFWLDSGSTVKLRFVSTSAIDKVRLRHLYNYISRIVNHQNIDKDELKMLVNNNIDLEKEFNKK